MKLTQTIRAQMLTNILADVPSIDYISQMTAIAKDLALRLAPKVIQEAYSYDPAIFQTRTKYMEGVYIYYPYLSAESVELDSNKEIKLLLGLNKAQAVKLGELRNVLIAQLNSCTTSNSVKERLPKLAKYLPEEKMTADLPATTEAMDRLVAAGWPKAEG